MIVTTDFRLVPDDAAIATVLPAGIRRPGLRRRCDAMLEEFAAVAAPVACHESFPIEGMLHGRVQLAGGARIGCDLLASVVAGAEELYLAVCTLGSALDDRIRLLRDEGRHVEMLLLDALGSWGVDEVRGQLYEQVEAELGRDGRRPSSPLSPGASAWQLREQRIVFRLLDAARIGVTLGLDDMMRPLKSLSLAFGAGAGALGSEGQDRCRFCSIRDRCRYAA